jgi:hypothetical protein
VTTYLAVNLVTGEAFERLDTVPAQDLSEALDAITARQSEMKEWKAAIERELRARLAAREVRVAQFGAFEVEVLTPRESEWDADALEAVLKDLIAGGHVSAGDVSDIITHPAPVVARAKAKSLRDRLTGGARAAVDACCTWKDKASKVTVTRSAQLAPATSGGALPDTERVLQAPAGPPQLPPPTLNHEELFK